jgi:hypothetical protein
LLSVGVLEHGMIKQIAPAAVGHQTTNLGVGGSNPSGRASKIGTSLHFTLFDLGPK